MTTSNDYLTFERQKNRAATSSPRCRPCSQSLGTVRRAKCPPTSTARFWTSTFSTRLDGRSYTPYLGEVQENYLGGRAFARHPLDFLCSFFIHPLHHLRTQQSRWADYLPTRFPGPVAAPSPNNCHASPNGSWLDRWQHLFRQSRISKTNAFSKNQAHFCDDSRAVSSRAAIRILRDIVRACARVTQTQV